MFTVFQTIINSVWTIMEINIDLGSNISFTIWQFIFTCILLGWSIHLFKKAYSGGDKE